jgi:hypothetical protein
MRVKENQGESISPRQIRALAAIGIDNPPATRAKAQALLIAHYKPKSKRWHMRPDPNKRAKRRAREARRRERRRQEKSPPSSASTAPPQPATHADLEALAQQLGEQARRVARAE